MTYSAFWSEVLDANMILSYQKRNLGGGNEITGHEVELYTTMVIGLVILSLGFFSLAGFFNRML